MKSFIIEGKILPKLQSSYYIPMDSKTKVTVCSQSVQWNQDGKVIWYWSKLPFKNKVDTVYMWRK